MIRAIITDIEGTTSSLAFVKEVLFPYAREHLAAFVAQHRNEEAVRALLDQARAEAGGGLNNDQLVAQMLRWIDEDQKVTALKALQGLIWEHGYQSGDFTGHIYQDAADCLRLWHAQGLKLYVYSSGSVHAQKLLFGHSDAGDLTPLFDGYFDTHVGHKREPAAYANILAELGLPADEVLFLSDTPEELNAARQCGINTTGLIRDVSPSPDTQHPWVRDFYAIELA